MGWDVIQRHTTYSAALQTNKQKKDQQPRPRYSEELGTVSGTRGWRKKKWVCGRIFGDGGGSLGVGGGCWLPAGLRIFVGGLAVCRDVGGGGGEEGKGESLTGWKRGGHGWRGGGAWRWAKEQFHVWFQDTCWRFGLAFMKASLGRNCLKIAS